MRKLIIILFLFSSLFGVSQTIQHGKAGYTSKMNGTWRVSQSYTYTDGDSLGVAWIALLNRTDTLKLLHQGSATGIRPVRIGGVDTIKSKNIEGPLVSLLADSTIFIGTAQDQSVKTRAAENSTSNQAISDTLSFSVTDTGNYLRITIIGQVYGGGSHASNTDKLRLFLKDGTNSIGVVAFQYNSSTISSTGQVKVVLDVYWNSLTAVWESQSEGRAYTAGSTSYLTQYNDITAPLTSMALIGTDNTAWVTFSQNTAASAKGMRVILWTIENLHR